MNMLSKFIIIENNKDYQCNTFEDVVKYFIDENYYNLTMAEQKNKIMKIAIDNAIDNNLKIVKIVENIDNINESFIAIDEITVILSILKNQLRIVLLERKDSNVFNKYIKIPETNDNYVIINTFSKHALKNYIDYVKGCQRGRFLLTTTCNFFWKRGRTLIKIKDRPRFSIVKFSTLIYNFNNKRKIWINKHGGKIIWQKTMRLIKF